MRDVQTMGTVLLDIWTVSTVLEVDTVVRFVL